MKAIFLRPLAVFSITFYTLSCISFAADRSFRLLSAAIFIFLFISVLAFRIISKKRIKNAYKRECLRTLSFLFAGAALASSLYYHAIDLRFEKLEKYDGKTARVCASVESSSWQSSYGAYYTVKVKSIDDNAVDIYMNLSAPPGFSDRDIIEFEADISLPKDSEQFKEKTYYLSRGIFLKGECEKAEHLGREKPSLLTYARDLNLGLSDKFVDILGKESGGFAAALILGNDSFLSEEFQRDFTRLGLCHVLALSGMHLTVICAALNALLKNLSVNTRRLLSVFTVLFYMMITGFCPSITRAGIMLIIMIASSFFKKGTDGFTNLGISGLLICLFDPYSAGDIGLQLSFCCVMALLLFTEKKEKLEAEKTDLKKANPILLRVKAFFKVFSESMLLTVIICLFILPLSWLYFGEISLISPITSPIFSLLCNFLIWLLPLLLLLSPAPALCSVAGDVTANYIGFIFAFANRLSLRRNIVISLEYPLALLFCILIFLSVIAFCVAKRFKRAISIALSVAIICTFNAYIQGYNQKFDNVTVVCPVTHKASEGIVILSEQKAMVIDIGNGYKSVGTSAFFKAGKNRCVEIETYMLTHYHTAYRSTLANLFSTTVVRTLLVPEGDDFELLKTVAEEYNVGFSTYTPGDIIIFEEAEIITYTNRYIERSVQPIIRLEILSHGEKFAYFGGAYGESAPYPFLSDYDCVWFGDHGPLYKNDFSFSNGPDKVFASTNADSFLDTPSAPPKEFLLGNAE